jgi:VCBS repeat-containing protein
VLSYSGVTSGNAGSTINGQYGTLSHRRRRQLQLHPQRRDPGRGQRTFSYTVRDGDGDTATANLVIAIADSGTTLTIPPVGTPGQTLVLESDLPAGSNAAGAGEFTSGTITYTAPDGPATVVIGGTTVTTIGQTIAGSFGTLTITSVANGAVGYTYQLTTNTSGDNTSDAFAVTITDKDNDSSSGTLTVNIVDDVPTARADIDSVTEDGPLVADGNVITASGGTDANATDGVADTRGADGASVTAVSFGASAGTVGGATAGTYGSLTLNANGSYVYTLDNTKPAVQGLDSGETLTETFTYTLTDGDGDVRTTTLAITIIGTNDAPVVGTGAASVSEEGLTGGIADAVGSPDTTNATVATGAIAISDVDGEPATVTLGNPGLVLASHGTTVTWAGVGTATLIGSAGGVEVIRIAIDNSGNYTVTLSQPVDHVTANVEDASSFIVPVNVSDGTVTVPTTLTVSIEDDSPIASPDNNMVDEGAQVSGNVISDGTDDRFGADGPTTTVPAGGVIGVAAGTDTSVQAGGAPGTPIVTALGTLTLNADGSYSYVAKSNTIAADTTDSFTYTIRDADGDTSTTTLVITVKAVNGAVSDVDVDVDESGLDGIGSQAVPNGEFDTNGQITVTGATGTFTYTLTSSPPSPYGTLTLNSATGHYDYTLNKTFDNADANDGRQVISGVESYGYQVTDQSGNLIGTGTIQVNVRDDIPTAVAGPALSVIESAGATAGTNLLANDTQGADLATVTHIDLGAGFVAITSGTNLGGGNFGFTVAGKGTYVFNANGSWSFDPVPVVNTANAAVDASFSYRITDGDGDVSEAAQTVSITDGANPMAGTNITLDLDDQNLATGRTPAGPDSDSDTITFTAGSDAISTIVFGTDLSGLSTTNLTWTRNSGTQIVGRDSGTNALVVTLDLVRAGDAATVTATLNSNYDAHPTFTADDLVNLGSVAVIATDTDGDTATNTVTVTVSDDIPTAVAGPALSVIESAGATAGTNLLANDTQGADLATVTHIDLGAGFVAITSGTNLGGGNFGFTVAGKGTYVFNANGSWSFDPVPVVNTANAAVDASFSYRITDGDGDVSEAAQTVSITDGANPMAGTNITLDLDDQNLATGRTPAGPDSDSDTITFTAGSDAISTIVFGTDLSGLSTTNLTWTRNSGTQIVGRDSGTNALVVTLDLVRAGDAATVTATLNSNYDAHPTFTADDLVNLGSVAVIATDTDGDTATNTVTVTVSDDIPTAVAGPALSVIESAGATAGTNLLANDTQGADLATVTHIDLGAGFVAITSGTNLGGGNFGFTVAGKGTYVFNANGSWSFDPVPVVNTANAAVDASFSYRITDGDGDVSEAAQTVSITDGANPMAGTNITLDLDDQNLATGRTPAGPDSDSDTITFTAGSDAISTIVFGTDLSGLSTTNLTWTRNSGTQIVGRDSGTNALVVTLDLVRAGDAATVTATLNSNYDAHPTFTADDLVNLGSVAVIATDTDGDTATNTVTVTVSDDIPTAVAGPALSVIESAGATAGTNLLANDTQGADLATVTHIDLGAGFVAITSGTNLGGGNFGFTVAGKGTYVFNANGSWSFDPVPVVNTANAAVDASFSYRITDGDGDVSEAAQTVSITDGANPMAGTNITLDLDDQNLATGRTPAGPDSDSDTITFTAGSDAISTIVFGTDLSGLSTTNLTWTRNSGTQIVGRDSGTNALVVTLDLVRAGDAATVTATLNSNYDAHPTFTADDLVNLGSVAVIATDTDGDTATNTVTVTVSDDIPTAVAGPALSVIESAGATAGTNLLANDTQGADLATVTHIDLGAGFVAITSGTNLGGGNFGFTVAGKGTYVFNANGSWSFDPVPVVNTANAAVDASFSYRITDGDGDVSEAAQTVSITDGANPMAGTNITLDLDDQNLATGRTPAGPDSDSDTITFTAGSDAISTIVFGTDLSGLSTTNLTWTRNSGTQIVGRDSGTNALVVTLDLVRAGDAATVTATLNSNYDAHPTFTADDLVNLGSVAVIATDTDGDTATNTVTVTVSDDIPTAVAAAAASGNNAIGSVISASLDSGPGSDGNVDNNFGADGGAVVFTAATITALNSQNLSSGLTPLVYTLSQNNTVLTATKGAGGTTVFTIKLDDPATTDDMYTVTLSQKVDSVQNVDFNAGGYNFVGGNGSWAGFTMPAVNPSQDLLLTPVGGGTVNTNANEGGIASGNSVGSGEAMRVDFVIDLTGSPVSGGNFYGGDDTQSFLGHYVANGAGALFTSINTSSTISLKAYDDADTGTLKNVGDGVLDTINQISISHGGVTQLITTSGTYVIDGISYGVTFNGGIATVSGVADNTRIAGFTANGFNSIEFGYVSGNTFKIGDFGASTITNQPVSFTVPITVTDGDNDSVASGNLAITLNPTTPPIAFDLDGDGVEFTGLAAGTVTDYGSGTVHTAWVGADDGILAIDANGDGKASGSEIAFGGGAASDLQGLAATYDSNHDGALDAGDADFARFGVWQDADGNGTSDAGEFHTLGELGIVSVGLVSDGQAYTAADGDVTVAGAASYTRADGSTGAVADAAFATAPLDRIAARTAELAATNAATAGVLVAAAATVAALPAAAADVAHTAVDSAEPAQAAALQAIQGEHAALRPFADLIDHEAPHAATTVREALAAHHDDAAQRPALVEAADHAAAHPALVALAEHFAPAAQVTAAAPGSGDSGGQLMEALLAAAQAKADGDGQPSQDLAAMQEAFGDAHGAALVDAIAAHFAGGEAAPVAVPAEGALAAFLAAGIAGHDSFAGGFDLAAMIHDHGAAAAATV